MGAKQANLDANVVRDFGSEWSRFDQSSLSDADRAEMFENYFRIFPWDRLPPGSIGADISCGNGRWASLVAPRVGHIHLVDPNGDAMDVARQNLLNTENVSFHQASVGGLPFEGESLDFAYSPGVLHYVLDTDGYLPVPNLLTVLLKPLFPHVRMVWGVSASNVDLSRYDWLS